ncbi:hypothetical protein ACWFRR_19145, partial [Streptomyces sp. NPDC055107]
VHRRPRPPGPSRGSLDARQGQRNRQRASAAEELPGPLRHPGRPPPRLRRIVRSGERLDFSAVFITHALSLLIEFPDRIAILYGGCSPFGRPSREESAP